MTAIPSPRQTGSDQQPADTSSWRSTINGWVRDKGIRRHVLIAIGMVLAAPIAIVWIIFHSGDSVLAPVLSTTIGKIVSSSIVVTIVGIGWEARLRRRRHRPTLPPQLNTALTTTSDPLLDHPRRSHRQLTTIDQRCRTRQMRIPTETPRRPDRAK